MKNLFLGLAAITLLSFSANSQFNFNIATSKLMNEATFGYKVFDRFTPYAGIQFLHYNFSYTEEGKRYNFDTDQVVDYKDEYEQSVNIYLPQLGLRSEILRKESVAMYVDANVMIPMGNGIEKDDGVKQDYFSDFFKDSKAIAASLSYGMEYNFTPNFSVFGTFGLRYINFNYDTEFERNINNPNSPSGTSTVTISQKSNTNVFPTFTRIGVNFNL